MFNNEKTKKLESDIKDLTEKIDQHKDEFIDLKFEIKEIKFQLLTNKQRSKIIELMYNKIKKNNCIKQYSYFNYYYYYRDEIMSSHSFNELSKKIKCYIIHEVILNINDLLNNIKNEDENLYPQYEKFLEIEND